MTNCDCKICNRFQKFKAWLDTIPDESKEFAIKIYDDLTLTEDDRDYYKAIVDGSWPNADEVIKRIRMIDLANPLMDPVNLPIDEKIRLIRQTDGLMIDLLKDEKIEVSIWLDDCHSLTHLPKELKTTRDLHLDNCSALVTLPEGLKVDGYLWLRNCTSLAYLPIGLEVKKDLYLDNCTSLVYISEIKVERNLYIKGCNSLLINQCKVNGEVIY